MVDLNAILDSSSLCVQVQVISVGQERRLTFWDLRDTEPVDAINLPDEATCVAMSNTGHFVGKLPFLRQGLMLLACADEIRKPYASKLKMQTHPDTFYSQPSGIWVRPCASSNMNSDAHSDSFLNAACGGKDQILRIFDFERRVLLMEGSGHSGCITSIQFSPDDRQLVCSFPNPLFLPFHVCNNHSSSCLSLQYYARGGASGSVQSLPGERSWILTTLPALLVSQRS